MNRYVIGSLWDRDNRNGTNKNFEYLFEGSKRVDALNNRADSILTEAKQTNNMNKDVQRQLNNIILENGDSTAEVVQARGDFEVLNERLNEDENKLEENIEHTQHQLNVLHESGYGDLIKFQQRFTGKTNMNKAFPTYMNSATVINRGDAPVSFKILGTTIPVPVGKGYEGFFENFSSIVISASSDFEVIVKGKGEVITVKDTFSRRTFGTTDTGHEYYLDGAFNKNNTPSWSVSGGKAHVTNVNSISETYAVVDIGTQNGYIQSDITMTGEFGNFPGLVFNHVNNENLLMIRGNSHNTGGNVHSINLLIKDNGSWKTLGTFPSSFEIGSTQKIKVNSDNGNVNIEINDSSIGEYRLTDDEYNVIKTGTNFGIMVKNPEDRHDNLIIKPIKGVI